MRRDDPTIRGAATTRRVYARRGQASTPRTASPEYLRSHDPQRRRRRTLRRVRRRISLPLVLAILVALLALGGSHTLTLLEARRVERAIAVPKVWPTTTVQLPAPVTATLTTHHEGAFVHYRFTVAPAAGPADFDEMLAGVSFTIRLLDKDGFTVLLARPPEEWTLDASSAQRTFEVADVVGSSVPAYASATSWSVGWESRLGATGAVY